MTAKLMKFTIRDQAPAVTEKRAATTVKLVGKESKDDAAVERAAETSLLVKLQNQQTSAIFDELFRRFAPKLKSYLISLGSAHDIAESVVQDVMTTVWTKSHLFDANKASARTWIFTLVRNRYIDLKRAEARQAKAYDQYAESGVETETSSEITTQPYRRPGNLSFAGKVAKGASRNPVDGVCGGKIAPRNCRATGRSHRHDQISRALSFPTTQKINGEP